MELPSDTDTAGEVKEGSDFNFRLGNDTATLSILLLTPSSIEASVAEETTFRLRQFSFLAGRVDKKAVVYLLSGTPFHSASGRYGLDGLVALQALMIESLPSMLPIIPIADADCFLASVQEYITNLEAIDIP
ncbi:similar to An15g04500 [Aspergillus luchuensis IFO 4308]|nr:similar to An15g04500 [Aspergillus luchuensis IFO 4308]